MFHARLLNVIVICKYIYVAVLEQKVVRKSIKGN
jgi:hypothetical protein